MDWEDYPGSPANAESIHWPQEVMSLQMPVLLCLVTSANIMSIRLYDISSSENTTDSRQGCKAEIELEGESVAIFREPSLQNYWATKGIMPMHMHIPRTLAILSLPMASDAPG